MSEHNDESTDPPAQQSSPVEAMNKQARSSLVALGGGSVLLGVMGVGAAALAVATVLHGHHDGGSHTVVAGPTVTAMVTAPSSTKGGGHSTSSPGPTGPSASSGSASSGPSSTSSGAVPGRHLPSSGGSAGQSSAPSVRSGGSGVHSGHRNDHRYGSSGEGSVRHEHASPHTGHGSGPHRAVPHGVSPHGFISPHIPAPQRGAAPEWSEKSCMPNRYVSQHGSRTYRYVIKPGDTLWSLSQRFGETIPSMVKDNHINNPNLIFTGAHLNLRSMCG